MIEWTCIQCENKYTQDSGDTEERMCNECLLDNEDKNLCLNLKHSIFVFFLK